MPVTTRKRKSAPPKQQQSDEEFEPSPRTTSRYKDDDPFERAFNPNGRVESSSSESEGSDYGTKRKRKKSGRHRRGTKKRKTTKTGPGPEPELPDMSDNMVVTDDEDNTIFSRNKSCTRSSLTSLGLASNLSRQSIPDVLRIQVNASDGTPTTVNLSIAELVRAHGQNTTGHLAMPSICNPPDQHIERIEEKRTGFMVLPFELRLRVYRMTFINECPIQFTKRQDFNNRAHFLRVCRQVAVEGTEVLYGQNSFHFERSSGKRGKWFQKDWPEIGFKDVRRFLETIGPSNISKLKHLSFILEDTSGYSLDLELQQRRYVNDAVLQQVFNLIGAHTILDKLAIIFAGRAQLLMTDYWFLKSLTSIKCYDLHMPYRAPGYTSRISDYVYDQLKTIMVVERDDVDSMDTSKSKKVKMLFDKPDKSDFVGFAWGH